eukprot:TRINITY_DN2957_c0_g1_i2.p1 TRINITY_DN2957_c0_g1~~TRINITY_DN2957_c0_g1_i2.p1  ORF type:complete len:377 (+),score=75.58 TRINITY_DN2957_c0_g1_i2:71-1201(+)
MALRGESGWQALHQKVFGKERWPGLCKSLKSAVTHVTLVNKFLPPCAQMRLKAEQALQDMPDVPLASSSSRSTGGRGAGEEEDPESGLVLPAALAAGDDLPPDLLPHYFMDGASVLAALALGVRPGDRVLDLCAAPGGKSLVLATMLFAPAMAAPAPAGAEEAAAAAPESGPAAALAWAKAAPTGGYLVCNEPSKPRAQRLQRVLSSFLPAELVGAGGRVSVATTDAAVGTPAPVPLQRLGPYDRVLVDAPCTSDRHLARQGKAALAHWAAGVTKANAERQLELLRCAASLLKPGGTLLYSTCALSELENDGVVTKFLKRSGKAFEVERIELVGSEDRFGVTSLPAEVDRSEHGVLFLPDRTPYGPMYVSRLRRVS